MFRSYLNNTRTWIDKNEQANKNKTIWPTDPNFFRYETWNTHIILSGLRQHGLHHNVPVVLSSFLSFLLGSGRLWLWRGVAGAWGREWELWTGKRVWLSAAISRRCSSTHPSKHRIEQLLKVTLPTTAHSECWALHKICLVVSKLSQRRLIDDQLASFSASALWLGHLASEIVHKMAVKSSLTDSRHMKQGDLSKYPPSKLWPCGGI